MTWRFSAYVGDSWKIKPNFTLTYGLRYNRDTGRTDSDLAPIPCSAADPALITCTGNLLDQWGPGLGNRVRQPNNNFGPQLGFAWDPLKDGKTVIRAGAGMYYENSIFNNTLFDRPGKLATGLFNSTGFIVAPRSRLRRVAFPSLWCRATPSLQWMDWTWQRRFADSR